MAKYWVYLNDEVAGPYEVEQLVRLRGFSRQTKVCQDDSSGTPGSWISPAAIPELAHIFKVIDQLQEQPAPPAPKPPVKPVPPRPPARPPAPKAVAVSTGNRFFGPWLWFVLLGLLFLGGLGRWFQLHEKDQRLKERQASRMLVENAPLPPNSLYSSLRSYIQQKQIQPRWEFERMPTGVYHTSLSWYGGGTQPASTVSLYAFEVNLEAQVVRGLNSAAIRLLSEGFAPPASGKASAAKEPPKPRAPSIDEALTRQQEAIEKGDFAAVWGMFSERKHTEMAKAGISQSGFERLQGLTHRLETGVRRTVLKSIKDGDDAMLVLVRQTQSNRADIFIKQRWVLEDKAWKLDDEEKKASSAPAAPASAPAAPVSSPAPASAPSAAPSVPVQSLPGISSN